MIELLSNSAHLHLLLNHIPTVGFGLGLALLTVGHFRKNQDLKRTSLVIFFVVAVVTIATYVTGNAAESVLRGTDEAPAYPAGIAAAAIRAHEDAAFPAFVLMEITGLFAWVALWQWRRVPEPPRWNFRIVSILGLVTFAAMSWAANLGGDIHHPEIWAVPAELARPSDSDQPPVARSTERETETETQAEPEPEPEGTIRRLGRFVNEHQWVWPACETLHFIGLCMLFGVVLVANLRVLGMMKSIPLSAVYRLLPVGILGFGINLATGVLFFIALPSQYVHNPIFFWKIAFVLLGGLNLTNFMLDDELWMVPAGANARGPAKMAAALAIVIWAAVLFCGHMLPFLGNAF